MAMIDDMREEYREENRRTDAMNDGHHLRAAEQPDDHGCPGALGIEDRHSRQDQRHGAQQNGRWATRQTMGKRWK